MPEVDAAVAVHGAVLVLSSPGLAREAAEQGVPLERIEFEAVRAAAADVSQNYRLSERLAIRRISNIVSHYTD